MVHDLEDPATSPATGAPDGMRIVRVDAERCAGEEPGPSGPRSWMLQLDDHRLVPARSDGATLADGELAPGTCERGTVELLVPRDAGLAAVVAIYGGAFEEARWQVPTADTP